MVCCPTELWGAEDRREVAVQEAHANTGTAGLEDPPQKVGPTSWAGAVAGAAGIGETEAYRWAYVDQTTMLSKRRGSDDGIDGKKQSCQLGIG